MTFLKINGSDPSTLLLLYHVAEPGPEVHDHPSDSHYCTAVSQLLAFTIMALEGPAQRTQDERNRAIGNSQRWAENWEAILAEMYTKDRSPPLPLSPGDTYR